MTYETLRLDVEDTLAIITLDRPKALNALNAQALQELEAALRSVAQNASLRALIITGGGEKAFVAGADISVMAAMTPSAALAFAETGHRVFDLIEALPIPTIAAVNGFALGGGCELALSCDLIYASEKAKLGLPEVGLGIIPGFGGTQRLTRLIGRSRAKEMILTGEAIDANKAREIGLVLEVLPPEKLMEHCRGVALKLMKKGPLALAQAKRVIEYGADADLRSANALERIGFSGLFLSEDQQEGMKAFLEKRPAVFKGK